MELDYQTVSYVNNKAESAGVLITIASEKVAMSEGATIGSAETIPNTEKILSMWSGILRGTAQKRGRDSEIIESMANKDISIDGIIEEGKILNLSSEEALKLGVSDYQVNSHRELLDSLGYNDIEGVTIEENLSLEFSKFIGSPALTRIFVTLGILGFATELMVPGVGLGGVVSLISIGFYMGGNIVAGKDIPTAALFMIVGGLLLVLEFIIPGFGLAGISGIMFVVIGMVFIGQILNLSSATMFLILALLIVAMAYIIRRSAKSKRVEKIVLKENLTSERGYTSSEIKKEYLGKKGIARTDLRPSGFMEIDGRSVDVISEGEYIKKGTEVEVVKVEGSKVIIRRA